MRTRKQVRARVKCHTTRHTPPVLDEFTKRLQRLLIIGRHGGIPHAHAPLPLSANDVPSVRRKTHVSTRLGLIGTCGALGAVHAVQEFGRVLGEGVNDVVGVTAGAEKHQLPVVRELEFAPGRHAGGVGEGGEVGVVRDGEGCEGLLVVVAEVVQHYATAGVGGDSEDDAAGIKGG